MYNAQAECFRRIAAMDGTLGEDEEDWGDEEDGDDDFMEREKS